MPVVFVHGFPETMEVWEPLGKVVDRDVVALALPGFGTVRPEAFTGTKDAYAEWLAEALNGFAEPVDVVGHDVGALLTMRVATAFDVPLRSWAVDVADIFHPRFAWPDRVRALQKPGVGEEMLRAAREAAPDDPQSIVSRLVGAGAPHDLARAMASANDEVMSQSILDFYRSAIPSVGADWWRDVTGPTRSRGLVLLLPDPSKVEGMALEVAERLGAQTASLGDLNHCWMAEAPEVAAQALEHFWSSLAPAD
jgi:pimeloyl-ACP methyl ester carboxylesterase